MPDPPASTLPFITSKLGLVGSGWEWLGEVRSGWEELGVVRSGQDLVLVCSEYLVPQKSESLMELMK